MKNYNTEEAAKKLGYANGAVIRALIKSKGLEFERIGRQWIIPEKELGKLQRVKSPYKKRKQRRRKA